MKLSELLKTIQPVQVTGSTEKDITGVNIDSRLVAAGHLFMAMRGTQTDGHAYIPAAIEKGAIAVLCEDMPEEPTPNITYIQVKDSENAVGKVATAFYGDPTSKMELVGVTGTNGKTTIATLLYNTFRHFGYKVGLISTVCNYIDDRAIPTEHTTPDPITLNRLLGEMADSGCKYAFMEVSSHSIAQQRISGLKFAGGIFTNLTEDHLGFHKTMDAYCEAKAMLFTRCRHGVVNTDDAYAQKIMAHATCSLLRYAEKDPEAELRAEDIELAADHVAFTAKTAHEQAQVRLAIPGGFTVYNALAVIGAGLTLGIPLSKIADALKTASGVKGRVEVVPTPGKPYTVLIDYSHTPDSLENVLKTVRGFCKGRVIAVFGCGGDRDPFKRPIMGRIGAELADLCVVTSDNPRTEDPMAIIDAIVSGMQESKHPYVVIENRVEAIGWAMAHAQKDDVIVLCGKGHETYQEIGHEKRHLDEREVVADFLGREV